jgi:hypothetical protein
VGALMRRAPAIVIQLVFEQPLRVVAAWEHDGDERRLREWLEAHPELAELVARALSLEGRRAA